MVYIERIGALNDEGGQKLLCIHKTRESYISEALFPVRFVPLLAGLPPREI